MYPLLETIQIKNGKIQNLFYHNKRLNHSRKDLFGLKNKVDLKEKLQINNDKNKNLILQVKTFNSNESFENIEIEKQSEVYKLRLIYSKELLKAEVLPYEKKSIRSLKIIECDNIDYSYKYENRDIINQLLLKKENCDDICIVKNGFITDSSYANLVFFDGQHYITPKMPLLNGTKREKYLAENKILESEIKPEDLEKFKQVYCINAMVDLFEMPVEIN
ncbi:MAG: aminotransferase class IV [Spirochaetia bacterium]|nr:aminotransferase class IV [Spirochaetia bacterium]